MPRMKRANKVVTVVDRVLLSDGNQPIAECSECGSLGSQVCAPDCAEQRAPDSSSEQLDDVTKQKEVTASRLAEEVFDKVKTGEAVHVTTKETKMTKRTRKTKTTVKPDFYKRYHHVVPGSVREPGKVDLRSVTNCHGRVCDVKCVDCKRVFVINTQDAFQCLRCDECKAKRSKERRNERNSKKRAKRSR